MSQLLVRKFPLSTVDDDDFNCDFDERLYYPLLSIGRRAFSYYAPRLWNALPLVICSSLNKDIFKKRLKTYLQLSKKYKKYVCLDRPDYSLYLDEKEILLQAGLRAKIERFE